MKLASFTTGSSVEIYYCVNYHFTLFLYPRTKKERKSTVLFCAVQTVDTLDIKEVGPMR